MGQGVLFVQFIFLWFCFNYFMNVTVRQLQVFVTVAGTRSFAEAGTILHLSQPALSIAIKNLEDALGGKLLVRTTRSVMMTPEGESFYAGARQLLSDYDRCLEDVRNLFALRRGRLVIAAMPTFAGTLLPSILAEFQRRHPAINITVHDIVAEQVVDQVLKGRVELGITFDPGDIEGIAFQPLFLDHFVAVFPANHHLLQRRRLSWKALQGESFITLQRPSSIRKLVMDTLAEQGVAISPALEAHQLSVVGRMVADGLGISIIPAISANQMREMGAECRPIRPLIGRRVGVVTHRQRPLSTITESMIEVLQHWKTTFAKQSVTARIS